MEYRIDVVDAHTDKPIGMFVLTAQGLLQQQRDNMVATEGFAVMNPFQRPSICTEKHRWRLELRTGMKSGEYFAASSGRKNGEITGWLDIDLCLTENTEQLYSSRPIECPARPADALNVEMFQVHIARIGRLLEDIKKAVEAFSYVISWKNPALTSLSLILFIVLCLRFNAEYVLSLPVFFLLVYMSFLATVRKGGGLKDRFVERETMACLETEKHVSVKYSVYRPIGRLQVTVRRGRNIRSRDLGIAGSAGSRIYWDPLRYCKSEKTKASLIAVDFSLSASHDIGTTNFHYSANPIWGEVHESEETKRLQQLIPSQGEFFGAPSEISSGATESTAEMKDEVPVGCLFPVLQPIKVIRQQKGNLQHGKESADQAVVELDKWESSSSAVVFEVRFQDVLMKLPGFDDVLGEVSFPLSRIIEDGEIHGWFRVLDPGDDALSPVSATYPDSEMFQNAATHPEVYLEMKWIPPESNDCNTDSEREASVVIAEEMIRVTSQAKNTGLDLMGTSMGALNTVTGLSGHVLMIQNALGSILDTVESVRNAFNFTVRCLNGDVPLYKYFEKEDRTNLLLPSLTQDPYKSSIVFGALVILWLFLAIVPLRMLILVGGLVSNENLHVLLQTIADRILRTNASTVGTLFYKISDGISRKIIDRRKRRETEQRAV